MILTIHPHVGLFFRWDPQWTCDDGAKHGHSAGPSHVYISCPTRWMLQRVTGPFWTDLCPPCFWPNLDGQDHDRSDIGLIDWWSSPYQKLDFQCPLDKYVLMVYHSMHLTNMKSTILEGASVVVTCKIGRKRGKMNWAVGTTDEYGDFIVDLPSHLHANPRLEKACMVRVLRLPKSSACWKVFPGKPKGIRLSSVGNGIRTYTTGTVRLQSKSKVWRICLKRARDLEEERSWWERWTGDSRSCVNSFCSRFKYMYNCLSHCTSSAECRMDLVRDSPSLYIYQYIIHCFM